MSRGTIHKILTLCLFGGIIVIQCADMMGLIRNFQITGACTVLLCVVLMCIYLADMSEITFEHNKSMSDVTGVSNRKAFTKKIDELKAKESIIGTAAIVFDLNNLKKTNDTLGHEMGDNLIAGFSELILSVRPAKAFVARTGGDEFVMILEKSNEFQVKSIIDQMEKKKDAINKKRHINLSYAKGYAISEVGRYLLPEELIDLADSRMYEDKRAYKQRLAWQNGVAGRL